MLLTPTRFPVPLEANVTSPEPNARGDEVTPLYLIAKKLGLPIPMESVDGSIKAKPNALPWMVNAVRLSVPVVVRRHSPLACR